MFSFLRKSSSGRADGASGAKATNEVALNEDAPREEPAPVRMPGSRSYGIDGALLGRWGPANWPRSLTPKDDPAKDRVFDDEIDPSWRDPTTEDQ